MIIHINDNTNDNTTTTNNKQVLVRRLVDSDGPEETAAFAKRT